MMSRYYNYQIALLILLMSLIAYLILITGFYYNDTIMGNTPQALRYIILGIFELLLLVPLLLYVLGNKKSIKHSFRVRPISILAIRDIIFVAVGMFFLVELIDIFSESVFQFTRDPQTDLKVLYPMNFILIFIVSGLITPIVEEAIFRGYLLRVMLRSKYSVVAAIIVTSLVFMLSHLTFAHAPAIFIAGLILGFISYSFYSIIPCIIIHSIFNVMVLIDINFPQIRENVMYAKSFVPWAIMIGGIIILVIGMVNIKRKIRVNRKRRHDEEGVVDEK